MASLPDIPTLTMQYAGRFGRDKTIVRICDFIKENSNLTQVVVAVVATAAVTTAAPDACCCFWLAWLNLPYL